LINGDKRIFTARTTLNAIGVTWTGWILQMILSSISCIHNHSIFRLEYTVRVLWRILTGSSDRHSSIQMLWSVPKLLKIYFWAPCSLDSNGGIALTLNFKQNHESITFVSDVLEMNLREWVHFQSKLKKGCLRSHPNERFLKMWLCGCDGSRMTVFEEDLKGYRLFSRKSAYVRLHMKWVWLMYLCLKKWLFLDLKWWGDAFITNCQIQDSENISKKIMKTLTSKLDIF